MSASPRELVYQTLNFESPSRVPRDLWTLPWSEERYREELARIRREFPPDLLLPDAVYREAPSYQGGAYDVGEFVDPWGCIFTKIQAGLAGEVKNPLIRDWETEVANVHIPWELVTVDRDAVNRQCAATDRFVLAGWLFDPFERLQFVRGTEEVFMDFLAPPKAMTEFMNTMHSLFCDIISAWAKTDVDGLMIFDDWGTQKSLLISPELWRQYFKPMYRDYVHIARAANKKFFMHSDGSIIDILPDLVELGVDAVNSQLFCMDFNDLQHFAGRITFWGEIDRQFILMEGSTEDVDAAVRKVHGHLWRDGGCIAQCEFGAAAKPENVYQVYDSWAKVVGKDPVAHPSCG